jgi:hypothetical protein
VPDPLAGFVASIAYKPGWRFKLAGPAGRWLCVYADTVDSQAQHTTRITQHQFEFPDPVPSQRELCRWVLEQLHAIERHETAEFLRFDGVAPFFPNHQDEGSPYEHVERWESP